MTSGSDSFAARRLPFQFDFPAHYDVVQLDRIDRMRGKHAYGFPGAWELDPQQELADAPILEVVPDRGERWVGVFYGRYLGGGADGRIIGWPDEWSICVVYAGGGVVVRSDEPSTTYEIEAQPILSLLVVPDRETLVFADHTHLVAYGRDGLIWRSKRLVLDGMHIDSVEGDVLNVAGFFGGEKLEPFLVDLATGEPSGQPLDPA